MPKFVDHSERRSAIADAVFALVERGGVGEASLRNVATEAGLNVGSVRHYVDGHEGMLIDAVREMADRVGRRIDERVAAFESEMPFDTRSDSDLGEFAVDLFEELLPLDHRRRREVAVWLAFSEQSRVQPALQGEARALIEGSRQVVRPVLEAMGVDHLELRTEWLASTIDGLGVTLLHDPDRLTRAQVRDLLRLHLAATRMPVPATSGRSASEA